MKNRIIKAITIIMFPFYAMAYVLSHTLRLKDRENMPTFKEWFEIPNEV